MYQAFQVTIVLLRRLLKPTFPRKKNAYRETKDKKKKNRTKNDKRPSMISALCLYLIIDSKVFRLTFDKEN